MNQLFPNFVDYLRNASRADLSKEIETPDRLLIDQGSVRGRELCAVYAPFDHVNGHAKIAIVGLTPGRQQMRNAIFEARRLLQSGASEAAALEGAKVFASFSGPMRVNLVDMLDDVGVATFLGLGSTAELWSTAAKSVHFTSVLRYPVFVDGENYSGSPDILRTPYLREHLMRWFATELDQLPDAVFVPLGPKVAAALEFAAREIGIAETRILSGLPHPSGANAERIAFFLGRKRHADLSAKVAPEKILAARARIIDRLGAL